MSLNNLKIATEACDPEEYVSDEALEQLMAAIISENLNEVELESFMTESASIDILTEKSIVKLDKKAKQNKAIQMAVLQIGKEEGNKDYLRLATLWKMEKLLMARLNKKYIVRATKRAKEAVKRMVNSPSNLVKKAASSAKSKLTQFEKKLKNNNSVLKSKPIANLASKVNKL